MYLRSKFDTHQLSIGEDLPTVKNLNNQSILSVDDLKWIFAVKDHRVKWHYDRYYGAEGEPTDSTLVQIFFPIMRQHDAWSDAIYEVYHDPFSNRSDNKTMFEWLWRAIELWCLHVKTSWLDDHAPINWRTIIQIERNKTARRCNHEER